jgi:NAD(P)-dependent dehydrogenase (short-subunit alcohol dehydrogenase family)
MTFVIAGGTGTVGSKVTRQLLAQGQQVRVLTRDAGRAAERLGRPDGLELFQIDFSDPSQLAGGFQAGDRVYVGLGGSMTQVQDENALIDAAAKAGAEYLVRLSCNGVDTSTKNVILDGHRAVSPYPEPWELLSRIIPNTGGVQPAQEVGPRILGLLASENPPLRFQTAQWATDFIAPKLSGDLDGRKVNAANEAYLALGD